MPTVKRKATGAIVLKNGKVSCSCCAQAGCCMYPAQALVDGLYTAADLPAEINALCLPGETGELVFNKSGSSYFASSNYPWKCEIWLDPANNAGWKFYRLEGEDWRPIQVEGQGQCLIFEYDACGVKDQFEACYKIYLYNPFFGSNSYFATVYRKSLCNWTNFVGFDENGRPSFGGDSSGAELRFSDANQKWDADLAEVPFYFEKSPHQDTPAGAYPAQTPIYPGGPSYVVNVESCLP